jgi:hypothetical protein
LQLVILHQYINAMLQEREALLAAAN